MFTWICPQCGREVPPSYSECPDCAGKASPAPGAPVMEPAAPLPPAPVPPVAAGLPPPPPPPQQPIVPQKAAIPTWAMSILFALLFLAVGVGLYWAIERYRGGASPGASAPAPKMESPAAKGGKSHPLQKFIEVTGIRLVQGPKKDTEARFIVVNHADAEISDLAANVNVWARTNKSEEEAVGVFDFKLKSLGPNEAKELTVPLRTKLKVYELPDWQNITGEIQITAP